jgi:hypothetical protein
MNSNCGRMVGVTAMRAGGTATLLMRLVGTATGMVLQRSPCLAGEPGVRQKLAGFYSVSPGDARLVALVDD